MRRRTWIGLSGAALAAAVVLTPTAAMADREERHYGYGAYHDDDDDHRGRGRGRDDDDRWGGYHEDDRRGGRDEAYRRGYEDAQRDAYRRDVYRPRYGGSDPYGYGYGFEPWDARAHNGYYYRDAWYWGAPPREYYRECRPGYRALHRGARIPRGYVIVPVEDWREHRLYAPPRGHRWGRDERGEYFLLGVATGIIVDQIARGW